ncbi:MAG: EF-hand domain-containing protein [Planctomycetota bacterium]|nr:EF-hand domain-containing protein [Planctomycetota bacterium]
MTRTLWLCALVLVALPACSQTSSEERADLRAEESLAVRLDRGDWMVNKSTHIWKVMARGAPNRPPQHIGYIEKRQYRQARGGPDFEMYSITTRNRDEQIGHIDQLGRAYRYEPQRNGTFARVPIGTNTLELNVQAIFETSDSVVLRETSERRMAFDALDANGDGLLQMSEASSFGDRVTGADTNGDGVVDFEEFDAVDVL